MKIIIRITGLAAQLQKLHLLNIHTKTLKDGSIIVNEDFNSIQEAEEYLIVRSLMFHQDSSKQKMDAATLGIELSGLVVFGSVQAKIDKI
jgi:hypothetical protein